MRNLKKYLIVSLLLVVLVFPSFAFATWYNPFSWGIWNRIFHFKQIEQKTQPAVPAQQENKPEEKKPEVVNEIKDWKTYTNTKYGYEIKYPPTVNPKIFEGNPSMTFFDRLGGNTANNSLIYIHSFPKKILSTEYCPKCDIQSFFNENEGNCSEGCENACGPVPLCSKIEKINNYKVIKFSEIGGAQHYLFKNGDNYFKINYYPKNENERKDVDEMFLSFKFIK